MEQKKVSIHCSGHASEDDLISTISNIKAKQIITIHTESADTFRSKFANMLIPTDGESIII